MNQTEQKGNAAVSWLLSPKHPYEDRYRLLPKDIPLVKAANRGELFAVLDGIGSAPKGMSAAQYMADSILDFFRSAKDIKPEWQPVRDILYQADLEITSWGVMEGTTRPLGGCAGTITWFNENRLTVFHAGDTVGMLLRVGDKPRTLTKLHETNGAIYRYFGLGESLTIDVESTTIEEGDLILLMYEGVTKVSSATEAANLIMELYGQTGDVSMAAETLTTRSRTRKSSDDITVVLVEVELD